MDDKMTREEFIKKIKVKKNDSFHTVLNQFIFYLFATGQDEKIGEKEEIDIFNKFITDFNSHHDDLLKYYLQTFQGFDNHSYVETEDEIDLIKYPGLCDRTLGNFKELFKPIVIESKENKIPKYGFRYIKDAKHIRAVYKENYEIMKCNFFKFYKKDVWDDYETKEIEKILKPQCCYYCKIDLDDIYNLSENLELYSKRAYYNRGFSFELDRKQPNKIYSPSNIVLSCYWCNNAKTDEFDEEEFEPIGDAIREAWNVRLSAAGLEPILDNNKSQ